MRLACSHLLTAITLSLLIPAFASAQSVPQQKTQPGKAPATLPVDLPVYDVASIKVNKTGDSSWNMNTGNNTFTGKNVPLKTLLANAWDIKEDLISGLNGPVESVPFDIEAKLLDTSIDPTDKQLSQMMQKVLIDRFHLKFHIETKTLPVYDLTVARRGPKLKPLPPRANPTGDLQINNTNTYSQLTAKGMDLPSLAAALSNELHRTVIDKTRLTASYDFELRWAGESLDNPDNSLPGLFSAIEEQLGLKLQPSRGPVKTIVIDHVEMPTEN